jgi:hypothetical protein
LQNSFLLRLVKEVKEIMSLKKLSLAAAISIGILSVNGIAKAADPCPVQPTAPQAACPVQQTMCDQCHRDPCECKPSKTTCDPCQQTQGTMTNPVNASCPNCHPDAKVLERQAFAFPTIGRSTVVMPKGQGLLQIGGEQESVALGNQYPSGLTAAPEMGGALTVYPKNVTGAASAIAPVCPNQIMQGTDILRCNLPNSARALESSFLNYGSPVGAAVPIQPSASSSSQIAPASCDPCQPLPMSANPCDPCQPVPMSANPCDPCSTGAATQLKGSPIPIQTSSSIDLQKTVYVPVPTGAAAPVGCPVGEQYPDVSNNIYAGCDINTLTTQGVLAGYPDRYYKPVQPLLRSELASAIVEGMNLESVPGFNKQVFKDVPNNHWAKSKIDKIYNRGIMTGNASNNFRPQQAATKAEAMSALAKFLPSSSVDPKAVLGAYPDAAEIPSWAVMPIAQAVNAGLTKELPDTTHIRPNDSTSRSEIASMVRQLRQKLALEPMPEKVTGAACPTYQPQVVNTSIPTLKVKMQDIVSARSSLINDRFVAKTTEAVTINGQFFPVGSDVRGKVVEVIRPGMGDNGGIRLAFDRIEYQNCEADLPNDILSATVIQEKNPNIIGRTLAFPFTWGGKIVGIAGRTVGGGVTIAGDTVEGVLNNFGNGTNELFNAKFRAAGRSYVSSVREAGVGVYDFARTAFSGTTGVLKESADEVAYIVSPDGARIAQVNPRECLSIAFGCK